MDALTPGMPKHLMEALSPRQWPTVVRLCMGKSPYAVLNDHHRSVDDDAEVQRPRLIRLALTLY